MDANRVTCPRCEGHGTDPRDPRDRPRAKCYLCYGAGEVHIDDANEWDAERGMPMYYNEED